MPYIRFNRLQNKSKSTIALKYPAIVTQGTSYHLHRRNNHAVGLKFHIVVPTSSLIGMEILYSMPKITLHFSFLDISILDLILSKWNIAISFQHFSTHNS